MPVLSDDQILKLSHKANDVEHILGRQPKGWDIEWVINQNGRAIIVQARPNT